MRLAGQESTVDALCRTTAAGGPVLEDTIGKLPAGLSAAAHNLLEEHGLDREGSLARFAIAGLTSRDGDDLLVFAILAPGQTAGEFMDRVRADCALPSLPCLEDLRRSALVAADADPRKLLVGLGPIAGALDRFLLLGANRTAITGLPGLEHFREGATRAGRTLQRVAGRPDQVDVLSIQIRRDESGRDAAHARRLRLQVAMAELGRFAAIEVLGEVGVDVSHVEPAPGPRDLFGLHRSSEPGPPRTSIAGKMVDLIDRIQIGDAFVPPTPELIALFEQRERTDSPYRLLIDLPEHRELLGVVGLPGGVSLAPVSCLQEPALIRQGSSFRYFASRAVGRYLVYVFANNAHEGWRAVAAYEPESDPELLEQAHAAEVKHSEALSREPKRVAWLEARSRFVAASSALLGAIGRTSVAGLAVQDVLSTQHLHTRFLGPPSVAGAVPLTKRSVRKLGDADEVEVQCEYPPDARLVGVFAAKRDVVLAAGVAALESTEGGVELIVREAEAEGLTLTHQGEPVAWIARADGAPLRASYGPTITEPLGKAYAEDCVRRGQDAFDGADSPRAALQAVRQQLGLRDIFVQRESAGGGEICALSTEAGVAALAARVLASGSESGELDGWLFVRSRSSAAVAGMRGGTQAHVIRKRVLGHIVRRAGEMPASTHWQPLQTNTNWPGPPPVEPPAPRLRLVTPSPEQRSEVGRGLRVEGLYRVMDDPTAEQIEHYRRVSRGLRWAAEYVALPIVRAGRVVIPWIDGHPLSAFSARIYAEDPRRFVRAVWFWARCHRALHKAGFVMGDVSPDNVIVTIGPDGTNMKICDTGSVEPVGRVVKTPSARLDAIAPERLGRDHWRPDDDAYGINVWIYRILMDRPPITLAPGPGDDQDPAEWRDILLSPTTRQDELALWLTHPVIDERFTFKELEEPAIRSARSLEDVRIALLEKARNQTRRRPTKWEDL